MGRFYEWKTVGDGSDRCVVTIKTDARNAREVEAPREVCNLLDDLQREYWRLERREARHSWHLEARRGINASSGACGTSKSVGEAASCGAKALPPASSRGAFG